MKTFIVAEAGVNHNGSLDRAIELIDVASDAGADAVKFQTFKAEELATSSAIKAEYQLQWTSKNETQLSMLKQLELSFEDHYAVKQHCEKRDIEFMSTAFDHTSLDFLLKEMSLKRLKVPSGEITNLPLIFSHALSGKDIILSTGMATLSEVEHALMVIAGGYLENAGQTVSRQWQSAYLRDDAKEMLRDKVTLLHCTSQYPAAANTLNLNAISTLKHAFGLNVGYSDHSLDTWASISAVTLGARVIEKHFTLDKQLQGPDHQASLEPSDLARMISHIRSVEQALGDGIKRPHPSELVNATPVRKSLVVSSPLSRGQTITQQHLSIMRPATGMPPSQFWDMIGKTASKDYLPGELLAE